MLWRWWWCSSFQVALMVKNPPANAGESGAIPGLGRSPRGGNSNPLQDSCLENSMDRRAWWVTVQGAAKSQTQPSNQAHTNSREAHGGDPKSFFCTLSIHLNCVCTTVHIFITQLSTKSQNKERGSESDGTVTRDLPIGSSSMKDFDEGR